MMHSMMNMAKYRAIYRNGVSLGKVSSYSTTKLACHHPESFPNNFLDIIDIKSSMNVKSMTKITATIGPASEQLPMLTQVSNAGMNIMRLNFSHATYEEALLRVTNLKKCGPVPNIRAVMLDTQGPEIRLGSFADGVKEVELKQGSKVTLTTDASVRHAQSKEKLWISYDQLSTSANPGALILLDDGAIELVVQEVKGKEIVCLVNNSGTLGNKKGVNLPGLQVLLPAMSDKDKEDIRWGIEHDIDFIAASFTRKASDIREIRDYVSTLMSRYHAPGTPAPQIIAKIESIEALQNFDEILQETDGIMVARGDLGVEIPMETLANVQKEMVARCNLAGKPVVVATQMLESMQKNPRPTRAECTDVANAVFDGADCVMLSGESAKGRFPVKSVETMRRIVVQAERLTAGPSPLNAITSRQMLGGIPYEGDEPGVGSAVAEASRGVKAKCVVVVSDSYELSANISKFRPDIPIVSVLPATPMGIKAAKLLQLHRAVYPLLVENAGDKVALIKKLHDAGFASSGDRLVVVQAEPNAKGYSSCITTSTLTIE